MKFLAAPGKNPKGTNRDMLLIDIKVPKYLFTLWNGHIYFFICFHHVPAKFNEMMGSRISLIVILFLSLTASVHGQDKKQVINEIIKEANENSHLENLAYEITDLIGPRLVGTPQMQQAH